MEFASVIWDPHTATNIHNLEMVQRRAARVVTGDFHRTSGVTTMLQQLQWPSPQEKRSADRVILMFRIVRGLVAIPTTYLTPTLTTVRGHQKRFLIPYARTDTYEHSFLPATIRLWNSLLTCVIERSSVNTFRNKLHIVLLC